MKRSLAVVYIIIIAITSNMEEANTVFCSSENVQSSQSNEETVNDFEIIRNYIHHWLTQVTKKDLIVSSAELKKIIDQTSNERNAYQIVSVRRPDHFVNAGHIENAINVYWVDLLKDENLNQLDSEKIQILYCYYGHGSMISSTILNLLDFQCLSLNFGMMDWNLNALVKQPWTGSAKFEVEMMANMLDTTYPFPSIKCDSNPKNHIIVAAQKYLDGDGSPIIRSSDVHTIIQQWDQNKMEYQLVDVRENEDYTKGHIPYSLSMEWKEILLIENLEKLDPAKTIIVYSENGQIGQMVATILNLLGYQSINILFGMMDWNMAHTKNEVIWDGTADYPISF